MEKLLIFLAILALPSHIMAQEQANSLPYEYIQNIENENYEYSENGTENYAYSENSWGNGLFANTPQILQGFDLEIRTSNLFPSSKIVDRIYSGTRFDVQLEISKQVYRCFYGFINMSWFQKNGHSIGLRSNTQLTLDPLSFGLKYYYPLTCWLDLYAGVGASYCWLTIKNEIPEGTNVPRRESKEQWGAIVKLGANVNITQHLFVDLFCDYLYLPFNLTNVNNLGGFKVGAGLGVHF